jgi:hypothetical protein
MKDPLTGSVLINHRTLIGFVKLTEVDKNAAAGLFEGTGKPQTGDIVSSDLPAGTATK